MGRLDGQVAIVTGGAQGIGGAASRRLAEEGAKVLIADIDVSTAESNAETVRQAGGTAKTFGADLGKHENIRAMIERASHLWGRVDVLVNNAYSPVHGTGGGTAVDVSEEAWDAGMGMLVKSIFLGAKYAVPEMQKTGAGSIVNISSVHGLLTAPGKLIYETGKSAVIGVTRQMATDFGPMGIRVNAICPGHIATERILAAAQENPSGARFLADQYPLEKGRPAGRRSQRHCVPVLRGGRVHHRSRSGRGRRPDRANPGRFRRPAGPLYPGQPRHAAALLAKK